jgi:GT2 family glycosyltransferase
MAGPAGDTGSGSSDPRVEQLQAEVQRLNTELQELKRDPLLLVARRFRAWRRRTKLPPERTEAVPPALTELSERVAPPPPQTSPSPEPTPRAPMQVERVVGVPRARADIVIPVHDAKPEVMACLASIARSRPVPNRIIVVDDGTTDDGRDRLMDWCRSAGATYVRNESPLGFALAVNRGLEETESPWVAVVNGVIRVGPSWLDSMLACGDSDEAIGLVGPLSNAATYQSVPSVTSGPDWKINRLPAHVDLDDIIEATRSTSVRRYPQVAVLNGLCLLVRRQVLDDVGGFEPATFSEGLGDEVDVCLKAAAKGWKMAVADDVYVWRDPAPSHPAAGQRVLAGQAAAITRERHGDAAVSAAVDSVRADRVLGGLRAHFRNLPPRVSLIDAGRRSYAGRSVLFVVDGNGDDEVDTMARLESAAMARMGVDATVQRGDTEPDRAYDAVVIGSRRRPAWLDRHPQTRVATYVFDELPIDPSGPLLVKQGFASAQLSPQSDVPVIAVSASLDVDRCLPSARPDHDLDRPPRFAFDPGGHSPPLELGLRERLRTASALGLEEVEEDALEAADLLISLGPRLSRPILEAMAKGLAVAVTEPVGRQRIIRHGQTGFVFDHSSVESAWADLEPLINDGRLRDKLGRAAVEEAQRHTPERAASEILGALFSIEVAPGHAAFTATSPILGT